MQEFMRALQNTDLALREKLDKLGKELVQQLHVYQEQNQDLAKYSTDMSSKLSENMQTMSQLVQDTTRKISSDLESAMELVRRASVSC